MTITIVHFNRVHSGNTYSRVETEIETETETESQSYRVKESCHRDKETEIEGQRQRQIDRKRGRERVRETERQVLLPPTFLSGRLERLFNNSLQEEIFSSQIRNKTKED